MSKLNRFEWLKAVLQRKDLLSSTKAVASALSVQFANDETGRLNPSLNTLVQYLNMSLATVKRCILELVNSGWLYRSEGRGAGNYTEYDLRAPCKIISSRNKTKSSLVSFQDQKKGSRVNEKEFKGELSYIKDKQSTKQRPVSGLGQPDADPSSMMCDDVLKAVFVVRTSFGCRQWEVFSERVFGKSIDRALQAEIVSGEKGYWLPAMYPPIDKADWYDLGKTMICEGWLLANFFESRVEAHRDKSLENKSRTYAGRVNPTYGEVLSHV